MVFGDLKFLQKEESVPPQLIYIYLLEFVILESIWNNVEKGVKCLM